MAKSDTPWESARAGGIDRRGLLRGLTLLTAPGLAGCGGGGQSDEPTPGGQQGDGEDDQSDGQASGGGGDGSQLGERVPTVQLTFWAAAGIRTAIMEPSIPAVAESIQELGVQTTVDGISLSESTRSAFNDERAQHIQFYGHSFPADRLDPDEMTRRYAADWAGADGNSNPSNYASCDHTVPALEQRTAPNQDERRGLVMDAHAAMSRDVAMIPAFRNVAFSALNSNELESGGLGEAGLRLQNPFSVIETTPSNGDGYSYSVLLPPTFETTNWLTHTPSPLAPWSTLVSSPLTLWNENYELQNILAEDYTTENDGRRVTVELRDGTFHNGDEITAEDVRFTFQFLADNYETFPFASDVPYSSIETIDDRTVQFNFEEPFPPLVSKIWPRWGILHKRTWVDAGAVEDPGNVELDTIVASGPFQVEHLEIGQFLALTPHDGHPVFDVSHNLTLTGAQSANTAFESFVANEVQAMEGVTPNLVNRVEDEVDGGELITARGFTAYQLYPQCSYGPTKHLPFRKAIGMALNRELLNDLSFDGRSDPIYYSGSLLDNHSWISADELYHFTDKPTGDVDGARALLEEAGWGWDDDDNLRYPADADLSPLWPRGDEASSEHGFECLTPDGTYAGPG